VFSQTLFHCKESGMKNVLRRAAVILLGSGSVAVNTFARLRARGAGVNRYTRPSGVSLKPQVEELEPLTLPSSLVRIHHAALFAPAQAANRVLALTVLSQDPNPQSNISGLPGATFQENGQTLFSAGGGAGGGRGINLVALDPHTGALLLARNYDTWSDHTRFGDVARDVAAVPNGAIVMVTVGDEGGFIDYNNGLPWQDPYVELGYQTLAALGSQQIRQVPYRGGWAMIAVKGQGALAESRSSMEFAPANVQAQVPLELAGFATPALRVREDVPDVTITVVLPRVDYQDESIGFSTVQLGRGPRFATPRDYTPGKRDPDDCSRPNRRCLHRQPPERCPEGRLGAVGLTTDDRRRSGCG
jgi:hypothetical protein